MSLFYDYFMTGLILDALILYVLQDKYDAVCFLLNQLPEEVTDTFTEDEAITIFVLCYPFLWLPLSLFLVF